MLRSLLCSLALLAICGFVAVAADKEKTDAKDAKGKKHQEAKITKVDAKKGTVTVQMKDKDGKQVTKTFKLAEDIRYLDSTGRVAAVDVFTSGDWVLIVEEEGRVKEMKKAPPKKTTKEKEGKR